MQKSIKNVAKRNGRTIKMDVLCSITILCPEGRYFLGKIFFYNVGEGL